jgi:uncharacterized integral membrane protein (TIGR00698 family)
MPFHFSWSHLPPTCLLLGLTVGFIFSNPFKSWTSRAGKLALQLSVVLLGFSVPLNDVMLAGRDGFIWTLLTLVTALSLGGGLAKILGLPQRLATLVSFGTAICGGSAIAAAAPVIGADSDEIAASLATVFLLNAVALFLFPSVGHMFALGPQQFGTWAAIAIHDTSSVVGAALSYDSASVATATTVKLARALWIVPCCIVFGWYFNRNVKENTDAKVMGRQRYIKLVPWFIPGFLLASLLRTFLLSPESQVVSVLGAASKIGLSFSLLCIGAGVTRKVFLQSGPKAFGLGLTLWLVVSIGSLAAILLT